MHSNSMFSVLHDYAVNPTKTELPAASCIIPHFTIIFSLENAERRGSENEAKEFSENPSRIENNLMIKTPPRLCLAAVNFQTLANQVQINAMLNLDGERNRSR